MLKRFFLVALILSFIICTIGADETITKEIGDEYVTFNIPDDPVLLKSCYKALIDAYVQSENDVLSKNEVIQEYNDAVTELSQANSDLKLKIKNYEQDVDKYIAYSTKASWYLGGGASFQLTLENEKIITLFPELLIIKPG